MTPSLRTESFKTRTEIDPLPNDPELGFEPRITEPESVVMPLHYSGALGRGNYKSKGSNC